VPAKKCASKKWREASKLIIVNLSNTAKHSKIPIVNDKNCIFLGLLAEFQPIIIRLNIANDETGETESGNQNKISVFYNSQLCRATLFQ